MFKEEIIKLIRGIFGSQCSSSKVRKHNPPKYEIEELIEWFGTQDNFYDLYNNWIDSGCITDLKPSVDRLDDSKGYSLDNIRLVTCRVNYMKEVAKMNKRVKASLPNGISETFDSMNDAARALDVRIQHVSDCCRGVRNHTGGYRFEYAP